MILDIVLIIIAFLCIAILSMHKVENYKLLKNLGIKAKIEVEKIISNAQDFDQEIPKHKYSDYGQYPVRKARGQLEFGNIL